MAATGLSYQFYDGDGQTSVFDIGFNIPYPEHVKVYVDDVQLQANLGEFAIIGQQIAFDDPPEDGSDNVKLIRVTPREVSDLPVNFEDGGFVSESDMDTMQVWLHLLIQEAIETDDNGQVNPNAEYIRYNSTRQLWDATRPSGATEQIGGLAMPVSDDEAATKKYVDDVAQWGIAGVPQVWTMPAVDAQTIYTLTGGANIDTEGLIVAIAGALQAPTVDFTVDKRDPSSLLTLTSPAAAGQTITVINLGKARYVDTAKLEDGSVTAAKIGQAAVTTDKIQAGAVNTSHIQTASVTGDKIADGEVDKDHLADGTITLAKLQQALFAPTQTGGNVARALLLDPGDGDLLTRVLTVDDISDFTTVLGQTSRSALGAPTGNLNMNNKRLTNMQDPSADQDGATKAYVDTQIAGGAAEGQIRVFAGTLGSNQVDWKLTGSWLSSSYEFLDFHFYNLTHSPSLTYVNSGSTAYANVTPPWLAYSGQTNSEVSFRVYYHADSGRATRIVGLNHTYAYRVSSANLTINAAAVTDLPAGILAGIGLVGSSQYPITTGSKVIVYGHKMGA